MSEDHRGFIIDIKRPTRKSYVACLVVTPKHRHVDADVRAKVERNLKRKKAVQIAYELLAACEASDSLLSQVRSLRNSSYPSVRSSSHLTSLWGGLVGSQPTR
jgi:hypothetical protein